MAVNFLKKSKTETEKAAEDAKVREVVEATLTEIEKNGDQAVRELSKKFDNYTPENFRLNKSEIEVAKILDLLNIDWERNLKGFPYIDLNGKNRNYYPDFYVKEYDFYIEFKGFVTESMNHKMVDAVEKNNSASASSLMKQIHKEIQNFTGDLPQSDDMIMIVIKIL